MNIFNVLVAVICSGAAVTVAWLLATKGICVHTTHKTITDIPKIIQPEEKDASVDAQHSTSEKQNANADLQEDYKNSSGTVTLGSMDAVIKAANAVMGIDTPEEGR